MLVFEPGLRLCDVVRIEGSSIDKVTHAEGYLVLRKVRGEPVLMGELARGFEELEQWLLASLADFPRDWRGTVAKAAAGEWICLWSRA
jgi:hypothetical protein